MSTSHKAGVNDVQVAARSLVLDVLRRRASGESLPDEQVIASRPELAEHLRAELGKLQLICAAGLAAGENSRDAGLDPMTATANRRADRTPGMLQFQCPHCREQFETATDIPATEILCSSCGGHFSLAGENKETRTAPSLQSLAHFDLVERLGVGGFGTVWKARDRKLDRTVAIKIPRQGMLNNDELEKFLREARAAAQLQHSNIVRVHEVGRDGDSVFIVSDFVRGIPLDEWLTGQQPTMWQAAEICIVIAQALQHAHERGVIHRDLKPANILIDGDGQPHLMDFGLARRQVGEITLTLDGQVLGTPAYMSPEQAQGEAHTADARSDIYSLGVILFQLLTGELPFRGGARMLMHQVIHDEPPSPRSLNAYVPRDLETVTLKCLEKAPNKRYQSATELADDLRRWQKGDAVIARPIGIVNRFWRWYAQRTEVVAGGYTLFSALFGVAGALPMIVAILLQGDSYGPVVTSTQILPFVAGFMLLAAFVGIFAWSGLSAIRGRVWGLIVSALFFATMTVSSAFAISSGFKVAGALSLVVTMNAVPIFGSYVLGLILDIIALANRGAKNSPAVARIEKVWRWCNRSPAVAPAVTCAVLLTVLGVGWLVYHGIAAVRTSQSMAAQERPRLTKKRTSLVGKADNYPTFVKPPTAELRKQIGSKQTVLMRVVKSEISPHGNWLFLNSLKDHLDSNCFTVAIGKDYFAELKALGLSNPEVELSNVVVRVTGEISVATAGFR